MSDSIRIGCAGIVRNDEKILFGLRGKAGPANNKWVLPGGGVDRFESLPDTLKREIKEECGIDIDVKDQVGAFEIIDQASDLHKIVIYYWADYVSGELTPNDDTLEAKFLSKEEVQEIVKNGQTTPNITSVLNRIGWLA